MSKTLKSKRKAKKNGQRLEGEISEAKLRQLIAAEAKLLGFTLDQALTHAKKRKLPHSYLGDDLSLLIELLPA